VGELGYDTTNDILKVGDGASNWLSLPDADSQSAEQVPYSNTASELVATTVQGAIDEIDLRLDTIEADDETVGSIAKALKDAKDYADAEIDAAKLALGTNFSVADIAARDALEDLTVGDIVFVADDGDSKWAQYKVTNNDPLTFLKIMDQDIFLNALSAADVKAAYESNEDTNAFTDTLLGKLNSIEENATANPDASALSYDNTTSGLVGGTVQSAIDEVEGRVDVTESDITAVEGRLDTIEGDDQTTGSIAKALKDAKDYTDVEVAKYDEANEISYDNATSGLVGTTVQAAIDEVEGRVDVTESDITAVEGRLDTIEGTGNGSIAKALDDAKDYTDAEIAKYDEADEIFYDQTGRTYALGANVQAAIDAVDGELISLDGRLDTAESDTTAVEGRLDVIEGDITTSGSILKAINDSIGVSVQGFDANTVIDANYETFDPSGTYANLRAQATTAEDVGLGNVTNESKTTMFTDPTFTGTVSGVTATHVGLDNVTNESKATMFTDPTFTGTVSGVTATHVGLGNVTNESKTTMFTDPTFTGVVTLSGETKKLTGLPLPEDSSDATSKSYVDALVQGIKTRTSALVLVDFDLDATYDDQPALHELTANNDEEFPAVDGISSTILNVEGARILVSGQTNSENNGLYVVKTAGVDGVSPWVLRRCTECDTSEKIPGSYIFITKGTLYENTGWILDVDNPITFVLGVDAINVLQFAGVGTFTAGDGLSVSGTEFSVNSSVLRTDDIGVTVQAYDADTVIDANYETFDSSGTYANLRAQATTKDDVGLGNVTNDAQIKKLTSSTSGNVPA
jgi:hypothetical protein